MLDYETVMRIVPSSCFGRLMMWILNKRT